MKQWVPSFALFALIVGQILDGTLTYIGLSRGLQEGNPLMSWGMQAIGVLPTILIAKGWSILGGTLVFIVDRYTKLLVAFAVFTWTVAVLPWTLAFLGVW